MTRRNVSTGYGIILIWMFLPLVPVLAAAAITTMCGSKLDEGSAHPCIVFGNDIGGLLNQMSMMGWFLLTTFPTGIIALIIFSVIVRLQRS